MHTPTREATVTECIWECAALPYSLTKHACALHCNSRRSSLHTLLQRCDFHSLVLSLKKTSWVKWNSCSCSSFCAGGTSLSSIVSQQALLCIPIGIQIRETKRCLFLQATAQNQGWMSLWRQATEKKTYEDICISNLPLYGLPCLYPLPQFLVCLH